MRVGGGGERGGEGGGKEGEEKDRGKDPTPYSFVSM